MLMSVATAFLLATLVCKYAQAQSSTSVRSLPITIKNACSVIGCAREAARVRQAGECSVTPGKKQRSGVGRKRNPATRIEMSRREGMVRGCPSGMRLDVVAVSALCCGCSAGTLLVLAAGLTEEAIWMARSSESSVNIHTSLKVPVSRKTRRLN